MYIKFLSHLVPVCKKIPKTKMKKKFIHLTFEIELNQKNIRDELNFKITCSTILGADQRLK